MLMEAGDSAAAEGEQGAEQGGQGVQGDIMQIGLEGEPAQRVNISRVRMVLQNFLLLRILVNHILLSPWAYNLCSRPTHGGNTRRTLFNHRMLATIIYELVRSLDPSVPAVEKVPFRGSVATAGRSPYAANTVADAFERGRAQQRLVNSIGSSVKGGDFGSTKVPSTGRQGDATEAGSVKDDDAEGGISSKGLLGKFAKLIGMDSLESGIDILSKNSLESYLLEPRAEYSQLQELHSLLLPAKQLANVRPQIDEWLQELREPLRAWLHTLVRHVLMRRLEQKRAQEKKEAAL
jgi:hypothetical protein